MVRVHSFLFLGVVVSFLIISIVLISKKVEAFTVNQNAIVNVQQRSSISHPAVSFLLSPKSRNVIQSIGSAQNFPKEYTASKCLYLSQEDVNNQDEEEEDDDGWGVSAVENDPSATRQDKQAQLDQLQSSIKASSSSSSSSSTTTSRQISSRNEEEVERDLFIPIFAVVSLLGLFGAYTYETLRLASRGELYLPWNS